MNRQKPNKRQAIPPNIIEAYDINIGIQLYSKTPIIPIIKAAIKDTPIDLYAATKLNIFVKPAFDKISYFFTLSFGKQNNPKLVYDN